MTKNKALISGLIIAFLAGFILRLICVFSWGGLMFDEMVSVAIAGKPLPEMWQYLKIEMHPVMHFYYLHFWLKIWGNTEVVARLSSVFISLFCFPALYFLGKEMFNSRKAGGAAAILFSFSSYLIFYSVTARMYIFLALFTILSFYFFLKIIKKEQAGFGVHFLYILTTLIAFHTHLTAILIIVIQLAYLLLVRTKFVKKFIWDWIVVALLYLPWFFYFLSHKFANLGSKAWYFSNFDYKDTLLFSLKFLIIKGERMPDFLFFSLAGAALFFFLLNIYLERGRIKYKKVVLPLLIFLISFFLLLAGSLMVMRYYIIPSLGVVLLAGYLISKFKYYKPVSIIFLSLFLILTVNSLGLVLQYNISSWQKSFSFIENNEKRLDKIIVAHDNHLLPLNLYYQGKLPFFSFNSGTSDHLEQVLENCLYASNLEKNSERLKNLIQETPRIFLIVGSNIFKDSQLAVKKWFLDQGWEVSGSQEQKSVKIYLLEK